MLNVSTTENTVTDKPIFPFGAICGTRERIGTGHEGGMRLLGKYKRSIDDKLLISFITVVLNDLNGLKRTAQSIWNQKYNNIEFIIIDGGSTDGTLDFLIRNAAKIDYFISEKDCGIYNAMNKGLSVCTGTLINLINAGDWLEESTSYTIVKLYSEQKFDFLGGASQVHNADYQYLSTWYPDDIHKGTILTHIPMNHQAVFALRNVYEKVGYYDESHPLAADRKWIYQAFLAGFKIELTKTALSHFCLGGRSSDLEKSLDDISGVITDFFPFLQQNEAEILYKNLDEGFWLNTPEMRADFSLVSCYLDKYKEKSDFAYALNKALLQEISSLNEVILYYKANISIAENERLGSLLRKIIRKIICKLKILIKKTIFYKRLKGVYTFLKTKLKN